jgi:hypothetical protein
MKPVVRIVLDKETLQKLVPEGELDAHIAFDNSVINLLHETSKRVVRDTMIKQIGQEFDKAVRHGVSAWEHKTTRDVLEDAIKRLVREQVGKYFDEAVKSGVIQLDRLIKERLKVAEKLIEQHTSPEGVEELLVKACTRLVKGTVK